jgi:hypothetical protein
MACLEQLQQDVSDILDVLRKMDPCCDGGDPTDGDQYTDPVTDGEGDVPQPVIDAGYAEDAEDWEGFDDYKCMVAHLVVDSMEAKLRKIAPLVDDIGWVTGGLVALAAIVSVIWTGGLTFIVGGLIMSVGAVAYLYDTMLSDTGLLTLADDIQESHDALACAFYKGAGSQDSVDALKDEIDEIFTPAAALLLKNTGLTIDAKALYAGRYNEIDVAAELASLGYDVLDFECVCAEEGEHELSHAFLSEKPDWLVGLAQWIGSDGDPAGCCHHGTFQGVQLDASKMMTEKGYTVEAGDMVHVTRFSCSHLRNVTAGRFRIKVDEGAGQIQVYADGELPKGTWRGYDEEYEPVWELDPNLGARWTTENDTSPGSSRVDNWHIYYTVIKA